MCPTDSVLGGSLEGRRGERGIKTSLHSAFDVLDADRDGKISHNDLRTFYGEFSVAGSSSERGEELIESMISVADSNKDGFVEYDEFEKVLGGGSGGGGVSTGRNGGSWDLMEDAFKVMDGDGDGIVGHEDLKRFLRRAGFDVSDDDVKAMIKMGGGHEHGGVTFEGLLKTLAV